MVGNLCEGESTLVYAAMLCSRGCAISTVKMLLMGVLFPLGWLALPQMSAAYPLEVDLNPGSFDDIKKVVYPGSGDENIPTDLRKAQCGGWPEEIMESDFDPKDLGEWTVVDKIATVTGLPGRNSSPLGNIKSGMADREYNFIAPGDVPVCGFRSSCRPGNPPFYKGPLPCQRPLGGIDPDHPDTVPNDRGGMVEFSCGGGTMPGDGHVCPVLETEPNGLCDYMNTHWLEGYYEKTFYIGLDCVERSSPPDDGEYCTITRYQNRPCQVETADKIPPAYGAGYSLAQIRYCCTHQGISGPDGLSGDIYGPDGRGDLPGDTSVLMENCIDCHGSECRYCMPSVDTDGNGTLDAWVGDCDVEPDPPRRQYYPPWRSEVRACNKFFEENDVSCYVSRGPSLRGKRYRSYYRHYTAGYTRKPVAEKYVKKDDHEKWDIPVSCYRLYVEFDPFEKTVPRNQKHCVMAFYYPEEFRNFKKMRQSQAGKGSFASTLPDTAVAMLREEEEGDLWYLLGNAFALTDGEVFKEEFNSDINMALVSNADVAQLQASIQLRRGTEDDDGKLEEDELPDQLLSHGALLRAFDDTVHAQAGDKRAVAEWWQEQETVAHWLLTPPIAHILLPPSWSMGLEPLQPLFVPQVQTAPNASQSDPQMQVLDVPVHADDDLLGDIQVFLQNMLLSIQPEPIPVVIPLGSAADLRMAAEAWKGWKVRQEFQGGSVPAEVDTLITRLEEYANNLDRYRALRGEIAWFAGKLFDRQRTLYDEIGEWITEDVMGVYTQYRSLRETMLQDQGQWKSIQKTYREMHDQNSMPWCHNDRFTTPIYSLLDPWMEGTGGNPEPREWLDGGLLPRLSLDDYGDFSLDFTGLKLPENPLIFPVLQPIQVRIEADILQPPDLLKSVTAPEVPVLPSLPPVPSLADLFDGQSNEALFPPIVVKNEPEIGFSMPGGVGSIAETLGKIRTTIRGIRTEYKRFWDSTLALLIYGVGSGKEDFPKLTEQDCYRQGRDTCVHAEMDLRERLQRIGSRPAILLWEDFKARGDFRPTPGSKKEDGTTVNFRMDSCPPEDWACQLLRGREFYPTRGWQILWDDEREEKTQKPAIACGSGNGEAIDQLRTCLFEESLYDQRFPYEGGSESITPSFAVPSGEELIPDPKEETRSSSSP